MSRNGEHQSLTEGIVPAIERKRLSEPPIDVLFNPSLILKKDAWDIDVVSMLRMLLDILEKNEYKDLRICGVAALSSSMIHRIKVESIFKLQTLSEKKSRPTSHADESPIENLNPITIPFRYESRLSCLVAGASVCPREHGIHPHRIRDTETAHKYRTS